MEGEGVKSIFDDKDFTKVLISWSLEDIFNEDLYTHKVEKIPDRFESVDLYLSSYVYPLLEETRAQLCSSMEAISTAPYGEVRSLKQAKGKEENLYDVKVDDWRNGFNSRNNEPYKTLPGDVFVLVENIPENVSDLQRTGRKWSLISATWISDNENEDLGTSSTFFKVEGSVDPEVCDGRGMQNPLFAVFLINITPSKRIWRALHNTGNSKKIIEEILCAHSMVEKACNLCTTESDRVWGEIYSPIISADMNDSQVDAVFSCLRLTHCDHKSSVKLIWGPPGTGKTRTVALILFKLLSTECRILTCAPTNVAITQVASRVLSMVKNSNRTSSFCSLGEILLFGNKERLKFDQELEYIHLDYRVKTLAECFAPFTGWTNCFRLMVDLLQNCWSQYQVFLENESNKMEENKDMDMCKSFHTYVNERFRSTALPLRKCIAIICTHVPISYISKHNFDSLVNLTDLLNSLETLLEADDLSSRKLEELFSGALVDDLHLYVKKLECLTVLRNLQTSLTELKLPFSTSYGSIREFCFQTASLIFCTSSSSYKLYSVRMKPLDFVVIDEAAQLKECESCIPLQLPGIRHAVLVGDECQLPATVLSKASDEAGFGRSLFQRLSLLGHSKHLLNTQYRMHPAISRFPNAIFYQNKILDSSLVEMKSYEKQFLSGEMFGPYSFINVQYGREEFEDIGHSRKNMVEVSVVLKIVQNLYKAWIASKQNLSVGIISPYTAQVVAIQEKLGHMYDNTDGFAVKVKSIDGFQGGEEDIIIMSMVRSKGRGSFEFISNPQRTNVALTRARHCLWILGNERTLINSESIWEVLVCDAKNRQCFFNADDNKDLAKAILGVKKEFDQLDDLLNGDSMLFKNARWKVLFSDNFFKSFQRLSSTSTKKLVLNLLMKLSNGWRPKSRTMDSRCGNSSQVLKKFRVEGSYVVCTIDIIKESIFTQALRVWDVLPLDNIPKLEKRLDGIFAKYTDDFIRYCSEKRVEGDLEVPMTWPVTSEIVRYQEISSNESENDGSGQVSEVRSYVENTKVSDSLLLMKFYSLSSGIVNFLLSDHGNKEVDLPFEVTDEELEIILFPRSTFVLGRSGTGKTTVLTMKLFEREKRYHMVMETLHGKENKVDEDGEEIKNDVLRQLFVTVSPKLCHAVKQHVSHLKSSALGGSFSAESSSVDNDDFDDGEQFNDIPDSFLDVEATSYPLVITFHKFLMMLDGTQGQSYFDRFQEARKLYHSETSTLRSIALETFIQKNEVTYDRFCASYWPHFNSQLTKKLDSSIVFTEILSHIKGGIQSMEREDGKLSLEEYIHLSACRVYRLGSQKSDVYSIFLNYEKMKAENGEFDLADLVNDLHRRLKQEGYKGNDVNFVYIDEVQDLTMSQIALFKYICRNVDEGFIFSGDTAQTIARGVDFRFQEIRSLYYNKFLLEKGEKGLLSPIFSLSQNFRTHAGVLKLSQSIMELLYHFFPNSVDVLKPETSLIYGEPPVLLECENNENAIIKIFGSSGPVRHMAGFGAEQVILVRDDYARNEIYCHVGKQALVLTILECKGLEFQDVLMYNFFGSSPLKNHWRVIYGYMKDQNLLDLASSKSYPDFNESKHHVLCSELKQLYVAITRTRQRLWMCENMEEFCIPMFDYWKKSSLVQVRYLDDSLAQAMQVGSSPEEWKSTGIKLFHEHNYEMAALCFERAGDTFWERRSKATNLKTNADRMRTTNPQDANKILREAAEIFEDIGKADSAAKCFSELGDYERAGKIYLEKCAESELAKAAECFSLAGCYELAADVYAKGNFLAECLSACTKGKLFDKGLQYISYWRQHADAPQGVNESCKVTEELEQHFLEHSASYYHKLKDNKSMMKYVSAFQSMNSVREFLRSREYFEELSVLEEESGNFIEAAECFLLAGRYELAAEVYAKGNFLAECLSACTKAKLFDKGLQYISNWKQHAAPHGVNESNKVTEELQQHFLEHSASYYHKLKDNKSMMKHVSAFQSMNSVREFLRSREYFEELLVLEEESGNIMEAANIAKVRGKTLLESDLLAKAGSYKESSYLILTYVLATSLWSVDSKGWPLKNFSDKEMLLEKAKSIAKKETDGDFYKFVCADVDILADERNLQVLSQNLITSRENDSVTGEILSIKKILDAHLCSKSSKYCWEDEFVLDLDKHSECKISESKVSAETLVHFWNQWKDKVICTLNSLETQDGKNASHADFCMNYFGVRKQIENLNTRYLLLIPDAYWVRELNVRNLQTDGKLTYIDANSFVLAVRRYWCSDLLNTGIKVLENLDVLHKTSVKHSMSLFCRSKCVSYIFEVSNYLLGSKFVERRYGKVLENFVKLSIDNFFGYYMVEMEQREMLNENMIRLRGSDVSKHILREIIGNIVSNIQLTYGQMGRVAMMILGGAFLNSNDLHGKVSKRFDVNSPWKTFIDNFIGTVRTEYSPVISFCAALKDVYRANWRIEIDYISTSCFLYLLERLLLMLSFCIGDFFFTTKSTFVEWLIYQKDNAKQDLISGNDEKALTEFIVKFLVEVIEELLQNKPETMNWLSQSGTEPVKGYQVLVLRLIVMLCLLHVNTGQLLDFLGTLLHEKHITEQLPRSFLYVIWEGAKSLNLNAKVLAEALHMIGNPLVIVSINGTKNFFDNTNAIFMNLKANQDWENMIAILFPKKVEYSRTNDGAVDKNPPLDHGKHSNFPHSESTSVVDERQTFNNQDELYLQEDFELLLSMIEALPRIDDAQNWTAVAFGPKIKDDVKALLDTSTVIWNKSLQEISGGRDKQLSAEAYCFLDELNQFLASVDESKINSGEIISTLGEMCGRLQCKKLESSSTQLGPQQDENYNKSVFPCGEKYNSDADIPRNSGFSMNEGDTSLKDEAGETSVGSNNEAVEKGNSDVEEPSTSGKSTLKVQDAADSNKNPDDSNKAGKKTKTKKKTKKKNGKGKRK